MILLESCEDVVQNLFKIDFTGRHIVSFTAVIRVVTQRLVGEKRFVTTLTRAAKETIFANSSSPALDPLQFSTVITPLDDVPLIIHLPGQPWRFSFIV